MANENDLDAMAFEIFKASPVASPIAAEQVAINSYAKAKAFMAVRERNKSGKLEQSAPASKLAPFRAPNLPDKHPHNLVSQEKGDLGLINRIAKFLDENPPTDNPDELVPKLNRAFDLGWRAPEISLARVLLPDYVSK